MNEIIYKSLFVYTGVTAVALIIMVGQTFPHESKFTPRQTYLLPFVWPLCVIWFVPVGIIWWFKTGYKIMCDLIISIKTNEWRQ